MSVSVEIVLKSGRRPERFYTGQGVGQFADQQELESVADSNGVPRLSSFYFEDIEFLEEVLDTAPEEYEEAIGLRLEEVRGQKEWHAPSAAIETVRVLLRHFREKFEATGDDRDEEVVVDLAAYEAILQQAIDEGDEFRFEISA
jgi:hypothetical protein